MKETLRNFMAAIAVACAVFSMALGASAAFASEGLVVAPAAQTPAYLSICTQVGDDESTRALVKSYTQAEIEAMAAENTGWRAALYWTHGDGSAQDMKVAVTSSFVEIDALIEDAGLSSSYTDETGVKVIDGIGLSPISIPTKATLDECSWFYPALTKSDRVTTGGYQFKPVFGLTCASGVIPEGTAAGTYAQTLAEPRMQQSAKRFIWGVSPEQLTSQAGAAGNRLYSNVSTIVLILPPKTAIGDATVTVPALRYTGRTLSIAPTVRLGESPLAEGSDYAVAFQTLGGAAVSKVVKPGAYRAVITGQGAYEGEASTTFTVKKAPISSASFSKVKAQRYRNGKAVKPSVIVKFAGAKLKKGVHYTLSYKNNKARGTARITVKGKGAYFTGSKKISFKIR